MAHKSTVNMTQIVTPEQPLDPPSPSRHTFPPTHMHWDPGGVKSFPYASPPTDRTATAPPSPPAQKVGVANTKLPTSDPSKVSKGAMGHVSVEDGVDCRSVHMSDEGLTGVPTGVHDPTRMMLAVRMLPRPLKSITTFFGGHTQQSPGAHWGLWPG